MKKLIILILPLLLIGCQKDPVTPTLHAEAESAFSVSETACVSFAFGNLEFNHLYWPNAYWKLSYFFDLDGISVDHHNMVNLFQYGASGYNNVRPGVDNGSSIPTSDIAGTNYDWGVYCIIEDVKDSRHFRVLTADEWDYVFSKRPNARILKRNIANYLLLFPDNWIGSYNQEVYNKQYANGVYLREWNLLGIAVIPKLVPRTNTYYNYPTSKSGMYWTSTYKAAFSVDEGVVYDVDPNSFMAVQLVKDVRK